MKREARIASTLAFLLVLTALPAGDEASAQSSDSAEAVQQMFIGNYELVSYELFRPNGEIVALDYVGRIMYDAHGNMSAIGMPNSLPARDRASEDGRITGGFAYFGRYEIDTEAGSVTHHLIGSPVFARSVGEPWVRYYEFDGEFLTLSLKNDDGRVTGQLRWRRLGQGASGGVDWPTYGGDPGGMKYAPLDQIDRGNVAQLEVAWTWDNGEEPIPVSRTAIEGETIRPGRFEATPIVVDDVMYVSTPYSRVVALDASTGEEIWSYDPRAYDWGQLPRGCGFCHRGVAMWGDGPDRRIFINSRWRLIALSAYTGEPIDTFGDGGEIDLTEDLIWEVNRLHYTNTSPPVVWGDLVILGSGMPDDRIYRRNPPGDIQAFDVRTGERVWSFHTIPQEGELGNDTWEDGSWSYTGSNNVWAPFTVDDERGLVYLPVSTPNNDYYGGHRKGDNLFAETLVCLDARTGERVWHFQTVHHGIWDYDLASPPNLVTIEVGGRTIDAVALATKPGFTFVFDRVTGEPVWPIEERPVADSDVPGERAALTQPFPTKPAPFARQGFTLDDVVDFTPEVRERAMEVLDGYRTGPLFTPPSLEGTVTMPGAIGGANWGGAAFDPATHVLYVPSKDSPNVYQIVEPDEGTAEADYVQRIRGLTVRGIPIVKPPYATLTAIDLDSGEHVWQVVIGDNPRVRDHPLLAGVELPPLGYLRNSGPMVTAGGLVFLSGGNRELYAVDTETGEVLWTGDLLGATGTANPMSYRTRDGTQFVVIGVTGDGTDRGLIAFALPR